jgi:hypothetical protein
MDLREIGWDGVDWIDLAQDRDQWRGLVNMVMVSFLLAFPPISYMHFSSPHSCYIPC